MRTLLLFSLMLRNVCGGGGDDDASCAGAYLCAVAESPMCTTAQNCDSTQACVGAGQPDARCGSGMACAATMTCADPDESCLCFE